MDINWAKNVYWIGGSSCSGKSSCAKRMSQYYGIPLYNTDAHAFGEHMFGLQDESNYPAIIQYRNNILKGMDEFAKSDVNANFQNFIAYCKEVFPLLLNDIKKLSENQTIIVEGAHILPELIIDYTAPNQAIFLISTKRQQRKIWLKEMRQEIPGGHPSEIENFAKSKYKKQIEKKRVNLHQKIAAFIKKTSKKFRKPFVITDLQVTEQKIDNIVSSLFFPV